MNVRLILNCRVRIDKRWLIVGVVALWMSSAGSLSTLLYGQTATSPGSLSRTKGDGTEKPAPELKSVFPNLPPELSIPSAGGVLTAIDHSLPTSKQPEIIQTGCASCGSDLPPPIPIPGGCGADGCGGNCVPGRTGDNCCCNSDTVLGRIFCGFYDCLCCPDPCYEPRWNAIADSAFFVDATRPVTQMAFIWDDGHGMNHPDRAEYFWPRENAGQQEPSGTGTRHGAGIGPMSVPKFVDWDELVMRVEAATARASVFVDTPYLNVEPHDSLLPANPALNASGFSDITIGAKTLLVDCQLLQFGTEFKTIVPAGNFTSGLGTGHVSLEPSLLFTIRISPETYWQGQLSYWIAIGGDPLYQGNVFHMHHSINHELWKPAANVRLVGTLEVNEWSILGGNYTDSDNLVGGKPVPVSATTGIVSMGPGIRLFICDKIDFGFGSAFSLTGERWARQEFRTEFRWRY